MSIINNVTQQASVFMNNFVPTLSPLNKRIALAAVAAISVIALCYLAVTTYMSRRNLTQLDNLDQLSADAAKKAAPEVEKKAADVKPLEEDEAEKAKFAIVPFSKVALPNKVKAASESAQFLVFPLSLPEVLKLNQTYPSFEAKLANQYLQQAKKDAEALIV